MLEQHTLWLREGKRVKDIDTRGPYEVTFIDGCLQIGCQEFTLEEWLSFNNDEIDSMDEGTALEWWLKNRDFVEKEIRKELM